MIGHISQRATFTRLSQEGTYVRSDALWCSMLVDPTLPFPHVGYAIGRQIGGAVVRNRLRRRLRAIMTTYEGELAPGWYLFGVSVAVRTYGFAQLEANFGRLVTTIRAHSAQRSF